MDNERTVTYHIPTLSVAIRLSTLWLQHSNSAFCGHKIAPIGHFAYSGKRTVNLKYAHMFICICMARVSGTLITHEDDG